MIFFKKTVLYTLVIFILLINQVICFDLIRHKRQLRGNRPRDREVNATSIILETEERINNRTSGSNINDNGDKVEDQAQMAATCGGIFSQPQFIIESPRYPSNYPSNANCLYIFKGPYCQTNYTLQFLDFNLENSLGCVNDRLEVKIRDALCGIKDGFKQYATSSGTLELNFISNGDTTARGFRILVSRSLCLTNNPPVVSRDPNENQPTTTNVPNVFAPPVRPDTFRPTQFPVYVPTRQPQTPVRPYLPPTSKAPPSELYPNAKEPSCCAATYSAKRFFISSPGFPHSPNSPAQCSFTIYRASQKVCRLRIQMHYFWVGEQDSSCTRGYLQIDGKLICGCHTGLKLVSPFEGHFGNTKVFRYMNIGANFDGHAFSGFALEVIQDECPKRYLPDSSEISNHPAEILPRFNFYQDQFNRVGFPNLTHEALSSALLNGNTEVFEPIDLGFRPRVVKHVYYFDSPDYTYDVSYSYNKQPRDVEETNYLETTDLNALYPSGFDLNKCTLWNSNEWNQLNKDVAWQRMPKCNDITVNSNSYVPPQTEVSRESGCKEYSFLKGYFQSPGYPYYYPKNINCCYRFYKQRGYCKIRLIMLDFQVEDSYDCRKDYLLMNNNFRYCGQSLANTFTLFDMSGKSFEQIRFVTNDRIGGRGFRGIYEQIPCTSAELPYSTTESPAPPPPPFTSTTTLPPNVPCLRNIKDDYFTIDIYDYGKDMCNFDVYKANPSVCRLEITFVTFDFPCDLEYLEINGKQYCGNLSGEMVYMRFENRQVISIIYKRVSYKPGVGSGLKLHMVGRQSSTDCVEIPPAERILDQPVLLKSIQDDTTKNTTMSMQILQKLDDVSVILRKKYPEVCGVVLSAKEKNNESLCNIILNNKNNLDCNSVSDNTIYLPYKAAEDKLELKFKDVKTVQEIEFKEITCDNKFIL
ncbi:cubilin isoform X1 [Atheta coriaria]|uniref:cubilin isoform X1 n=1 Tax=Dalotia coriaria TaxID=877792 RepID=UPI0031F365C5